MAASPDQSPDRSPDAVAGDGCPEWCVTGHGFHFGEEDWIHVGEPLVIAEGVLARPCMSVHPATGVVDGPYVMVGWREYALDDAEALGAALIAMARAGRSPIPRAGL